MQTQFVERRGADRPVVDRCSRGHTHSPIVAVARTDRAILFTCHICGDVFEIPKPRPARSLIPAANGRETTRGDVLILYTKTRTYSTHAVGTITVDGQQDFRGHRDVYYVVERSAALTVARDMVRAPGRIFLLDIEHNEWSDISLDDSTGA